MDLRLLRERACRANRELVRQGLVVLAFGNASVADRDAGLVAIKPSGIGCADIEPDDVVVIRLEDGTQVAGTGRPSSDTPTHLELYRGFSGVGAIIHTHSPYATSWAQAHRELPALGTTHADHFHGAIPVTRSLEPDEVAGDYETNTGRVIAERFAKGVDPLEVPAVLVASHGPFIWGIGLDDALDNAVALEHIAAIATHQAAIGELAEIPATLLDRHFTRKHGPSAYYGQPESAVR